MCEKCTIPNLTFDGTNVTVYDGKPVVMSFHFYRTDLPNHPIGVVSRCASGATMVSNGTLVDTLETNLQLLAELYMIMGKDPVDMMARATAEVADRQMEAEFGLILTLLGVGRFR